MKNRFVALILASVAVCIASIFPAFASHWDVTTIWEGKKTFPGGATEAWKADGSNVNVDKYEFGSGTVSSAGKVTFTYAWNADGSGQPAPPEVYIVISGGVSVSMSGTNFSLPPYVAPVIYSPYAFTL